MNANWRREIIDNINTHGLQIIGVCGGTEPSFAYTIGLTSKFGFELLIVGLPMQYAATIINNIAANDMFPDFDTPNSDYTNLPLMFSRCSVNMDVLHSEYVCQADAFYGKTVNVVQLVMCDRAGLFPNHPKFDHTYMDDKQLLFCKLG